MDVEEELSRSIIKLMIKEPFYAHFLGQVSRVISKEVTKTAAVGLRNNAICLYVNPDFFLNELKSAEERTAVLKHEVLHLVFKHLFRHQANWNAHVANVAADVSVNQFVDPWPLPEGAILLDQFSALNLEPEKSVEYYYDKLIEARQSAPKKIDELTSELSGQPGSGPGQGGGEGQGEGGDEEPGCNQKRRKRELDDWKRIRDILGDEQGDKSGFWMDDHSNWSDQPGDEVEVRQIEDAILKAKDRTKEKDFRGAPGWLQDLINEIEARRKPQVDWKRSLRLFASNSRRTRITGTVKRMSKRFGAPNPGIKIKRFQRIVAIVDTSGSMVAFEVISPLFAEIHAIWKSGAEIHIVECDTIVHRSYDYTGTIPTFVEGGGGNDCDPAFEYLWQYRKLGMIDGCLFLTDGYFDTPTIKPPCKLLWVLTPDGTDEHLAFGSSIKLDY